MIPDGGSSLSIRVLGFAGSLRAESLNKKLLRAAVDLAPSGMRIEIHDLAQIPLYNSDIEQAGDPAPVAQFKSAIERADALLIATPEYQHGVPGVLKNALDWASRPPGRSVLQSKPVAIMGASPGFTGTARAQAQLRQSFTFSQACAVQRPEVLVGRAQEKFDGEGHLIDTTARNLIRELLEELGALVRLFKGSAAARSP